MVEINNQRKAPRYAGGSEGTDNGRRNEIMVMTSGCRRRVIYWLPDHLKSVNAKPKLKSPAPDATSFSPVGGMPTASSWPERLPLRKVRTLWHLRRLRSVALYLWLIVVISVRQSTVAVNIWASLPGAGYGRLRQGWQPDCKIQRSGRNGQKRDWCASRVTAIISALVGLHHRSLVMGC